MRFWIGCARRRVSRTPTHLVDEAEDEPEEAEHREDGERERISDDELEQTREDHADAAEEIVVARQRDERGRVGLNVSAARRRAQTLPMFMRICARSAASLALHSRSTRE